MLTVCRGAFLKYLSEYIDERLSNKLLRSLGGVNDDHMRSKDVDMYNV
jgi:hypothetical protein